MEIEHQVPRVPQPGNARDELNDLIETLHRVGALRVANDLIGRLSNVSEVALDELNSKEGQNLIGVFLSAGKLLTNLPPDVVSDGGQLVASSAKTARNALKAKPPGTFALLRLLHKPDTRRAIGALLLILHNIGAHARLESQKFAPKKSDSE
ncbi:MAG TPA: DUF1641 domain-containing protein [Lacunisphaera sp.]